jgi:hypothetical protein
LENTYDGVIYEAAMANSTTLKLKANYILESDSTAFEWVGQKR